MRKTVKSEALVLKKRSLPNQDKLITFFTKESGKISAFAKGIKKITSRRLPHVQTANLVSIVLHEKDSRFYLQETTLISGFSKIKDDQSKLQSLYRYLFVIEKLIPEGQPEPEIYNLTLNFLVNLSKSEMSEETSTIYLNQALQILGFSKDEKSAEDLEWSIEELIHEKLPPLHI